MPGDGSHLLEYRFARKTANQTLNNSAVLQNDTHLTLSIAAHEIVLVRYFLYWAADVAGGLKCDLTGPPASVFYQGGGTIVAVGGGAQDSGISGAYGSVNLGLTVAAGIAVFEGLIENGVNAGDIVCTWAQNAAHANVTTVIRGSHMDMIRVP